MGAVRNILPSVILANHTVLQGAWQMMANLTNYDISKIFKEWQLSRSSSCAVFSVTHRNSICNKSTFLLFLPSSFMLVGHVPKLDAFQKHSHEKLSSVLPLREFQMSFTSARG